MKANRQFYSFFTVLLGLLLAACGGDKSSSTGDPGGGGNPGGLTGGPGALAVTATTDVAPVAALAVDVVDGVILTKLDVMLAQGATVGQVNAALAAVDGSIVHMAAGSPFLTVGVPRQADAAALAALAQVLQSQPGIAAAFPGLEAAAKVLPPGEAGGGEFALAQLEHLLPTRFPAAWNAKGLLAGCETDKVPVLVADRFDVIIAAGFSAEIPDFFPEGDPTEDGGQHGYGVTTTLAARFNEQNPTGANPFVECLDVRGFHAANLTIFEESSAIKAQFPAGKFIFNYSMGYRETCRETQVVEGVETEVEVLCTPEAVAAQIPTPYQRAVDTLLWHWMTEGRRADFVAAVAAGNERNGPTTPVYPGLGTAALSAQMSGSASSGPQLLARIQDPALWGGTSSYPSLLPTAAEVSHVQMMINDWGLVTGSGNDYTAAPNVVIVGSTTSSELFSAISESAFSDSGSDVKAVGEQVYVLELGDPGGNLVSGTSFSAPQVAGLASYLWLLSPVLRNTLDAEATTYLITSNTRSNGTVSGVIDAYAAVLSLDPAAPIDVKANIREAILDVDDNGGFDGADLLQFAAGYHLDDPAAPQPTARDYSRFDLNGDGYTGGLHVDRFDLDRVGSEQFGPAQYNIAAQMIEGFEINMNENALSDIQILCYYAYSPLYQGGEAEREDILGIKHCVGAQLEATLAAFSGISALLTVVVRDENGDPLPGVYVELVPQPATDQPPTGGTVSPANGTTDATGAFESTATLDQDSTSITVDVTIRSAPGGEILDQETVTGLTGSVKLVERMHRGMVDHNPLFEHEIHEVGYQGTTDSLEPYSDSSNPAAHTVTQEDGDGNTYSVTVSGGITQSVSFGSDGNGNISSIAGSAVFDVTANATAGGTSRTVHGSSVADIFGGDNSVEIAVEGSPVAYTLSGNLNVTSSSSDLFPRTKADGYVSIGLSHIDVCSDTNGGCVNEITGAPIPATADLASSGILQPGRHKLVLDLGGDAICSTYVEVLTCTSTASGSYNFTLTFSPAP